MALKCELFVNNHAKLLAVSSKQSEFNSFCELFFSSSLVYVFLDGHATILQRNHRRFLLWCCEFESKRGVRTTRHELIVQFAVFHSIYLYESSMNLPLRIYGFIFHYSCDWFHKRWWCRWPHSVRRRLPLCSHSQMECVFFFIPFMVKFGGENWGLRWR